MLFLPIEFTNGNDSNARTTQRKTDEHRATLDRQTKEAVSRFIHGGTDLLAKNTNCLGLKENRLRFLATDAVFKKTFGGVAEVPFERERTLFLKPIDQPLNKSKFCQKSPHTIADPQNIVYSTIAHGESENRERDRISFRLPPAMRRLCSRRQGEPLPLSLHFIFQSSPIPSSGGR